jgi:hypothetical protein
MREGRRMGSWALGRAGLGLAPVTEELLDQMGTAVGVVMAS